jgi:hypothetical protein
MLFLFTIYSVRWQAEKVTVSAFDFNAKAQRAQSFFKVSLPQGNNHGDGVIAPVTQAERPMFQTMGLSEAGGLPVQVQLRLAGRAAQDLNLLPADSADASAKRLGHSFLGSKARRQGRQTVTHLSQFLEGENAP